VVLVVLFAVAVYSIWRTIAGDSPPPVEQQLAFQCTQCSEVFKTTNLQLHAMQRDNAALKQFPDRSPDQAHCPKCGQKHAALLMTQCAKCREWFLPQKATRREMAAEGFAPKTPVCPHCGTDQNKWRQENLPR
jgi:DNA-directed RNA polymerase subunit M/transcription elongation factor TFIIS